LITEHLQGGDGASILGGSALLVVKVGWAGDDRIVDGASKVPLGDLSHLSQNHRGDLFGGEGLRLAFHLDFDLGFAVFVQQLERPELSIGLDCLIVEVATNEALGVVHSVLGVQGGLILGSFTDEATLRSEGHHGRGDTVTLVVLENLHTTILVDPHA
jgi:hypothetical protein